MPPRPVALIILDGWGLSPVRAGNAVLAAKTPNLDRYFAAYPSATLRTDGEAVGLSRGQMGNSEVGHLNLGAGRVVPQDLEIINQAIEDGSFYENRVLKEAMAAAREPGRRLHLLGLVSDGGVHSHQRHLYALLEMAGREGLADRTFVHFITDGRDTPPASAAGYLAELRGAMERTGVGRIGTLSGRYYAMDRDSRWERTELAYRAQTCDPSAPRAATVAAALEAAYARGEKDEFIRPTVIEGGPPIGPADVVICFNFRPDRARQILRALVDPAFDAFPRPFPRVAVAAGFALYDETLPLPVAFPRERIVNGLGEYLSGLGLAQFRAAETEKYAHVTYFFNGGEEIPYPGEERLLVPSPKVATYDLQPEMSAPAVAVAVAGAAKSGKYALIVTNFANLDMVGHTGAFPAAVRAVEAVDTCLGQVLNAVRDAQGAALVLADHGNAEQMLNPATGKPHTAHTTYPVPCLLVDDALRTTARLANGRLADVAPTLLELMGIAQPAEMTGHSLILEGEKTDNGNGYGGN